MHNHTLAESGTAAEYIKEVGNSVHEPSGEQSSLRGRRGLHWPWSRGPMESVRLKKGLALPLPALCSWIKKDLCQEDTRDVLSVTV